MNRVETGGRINWLASYPKSGNTWMRLMLATYFTGGERLAGFNEPDLVAGGTAQCSLFETQLGLDSDSLTDAEIMTLRPVLHQTIAAVPGEHWIKVHDAQRGLEAGRLLFDRHGDGVAVYILRNPLDVAVSLAFHRYHGDLQRACDALCDPEWTLADGRSSVLRQYVGDWSAHVASWTEARDLPVLAIRFEDMLADPAGTLQRVIAFGWPDHVADTARLDQVAIATRFPALREREEREGFRERGAGQLRFFRSGRIGDGRRLLSPAQVEQIETRHLAQMQRFGYPSDNKRAWGSGT